MFKENKLMYEQKVREIA
jgi:hypothetical protein